MSGGEAGSSALLVANPVFYRHDLLVMGRALAALEAAKAAGAADFTLSSSWCSDQLVFVALVRPRGARLGQPIVGDLMSVLERAALRAVSA